ncbi:unnamed protein product [Chondrus crispus]|uniref:Uncharacterized protein n=1 Tax=Chondrus crispus TaxID=2769 RepID=R7QTC9_CHOCR|nr:unnamed protein product [Chondrus crispus]CDF40963.1 unnamed protein product [Chondrus crispus]|eukprot:XP_005711257.1 unnamed protein product [Chondrus crispus]
MPPALSHSIFTALEAFCSLTFILASLSAVPACSCHTSTAPSARPTPMNPDDAQSAHTTALSTFPSSSSSIRKNTSHSHPTLPLATISPHATQNAPPGAKDRPLASGTSLPTSTAASSPHRPPLSGVS